MIALTSGRSRGVMRVWLGVACPAPPNGQWRADRAWLRILTSIGKSSTGCSPAAGRRRASLRPPPARAASSGTRFSISRSSLLRRRDWRERTGCQACRSSRSARPSRNFDVSRRGCRRCRSRRYVTLKYQADAWQAFFSGHAGRPRFKRRGHDAKSEGNGRAPWDEREGESRAEPRDPRHRLGRLAGDARLQGSARRGCQSGLHQPVLRRMRRGERRFAPGQDIRMRGLWPCGSCGPERGPHHTASGTGAAARGGCRIERACEP